MAATASSQKQPPLCRFYQVGECKKGNMCPFRHEFSKEGVSSKTPCKYYLAGKKCKYGEFCWYRHEGPISNPENSNKENTTPPPGAKVTPAPQETVQWPVANAEARSYSEVFKSNFNPIIFREICPTCYIGEKCPNGDRCEFIHGDPCTSCGLNVIHPHNPSRNVEHLKNCIKRSEFMQMRARLTTISSQQKCGICMEEIFGRKKFGILPECEHCFCLDCVVEWRGAKEHFDKNVRACPLCRTVSYFVVPSRYFYEKDEDKANFIRNYKELLSQKPCRNFKSTGYCAMGPACFFRHELPDGSLATGQGEKPVEFFPYDMDYLLSMTVDEKEESILHKSYSSKV